MMQWIINNILLWAPALASAIISGSVIGLWVKQKMQVRTQLLDQQIINDARWYQQQIEQLKVSLNNSLGELEELDQERDKAEYELKQLHGKLMAAMEKLRYFDAVKLERDQYNDELNHLRELKAQLDVQLREQEARHQQQLESSAEKLRLLETAEERLKQQFEHLANQVFEDKAAKVEQQNKQSLDSLLSPLKEQLEGFRKQVNDNFNNEAKERHTLVHELRNLQSLNEQMAKEALNLTQALKGDNKQQGNWGEIGRAHV